MKLIEKKCPNCGAGLKFDDGATSVACDYCSKTYYIQRDEKKYVKLDQAHLGDAFKFVDKYGKPIVKAFAAFHIVTTLVPIIIFLIAVIIIVIISSIAGSQTDDFDNTIDSWQEKIENKFQNERSKMVQNISQIDSVSLQTFHDTSLLKLQHYDGSCVHGDYIITKRWESIGVYLLVSKEENENILYDVFEQTYKNKKTGVETTLYAAMKYEDLFLTDDNIVENNYIAWSEVPTYTFPGTSFVGAYGYESVDKLYNKLVRSQTGEYLVIASEGLYKES